MFHEGGKETIEAKAPLWGRKRGLGRLGGKLIEPKGKTLLQNHVPPKEENKRSQKSSPKLQTN
ncbi:hypothetical protein CLONEX_01236 [[Clostridium] nexile DSM 1787]|nr:hypothetical protein CLONEX_01236 [[Clostridium] nexile DSM 1787]